MATFYIRTCDLTKKLLSFEKEHLDVISLDIDEDDFDGEHFTTLSISGVNSSDPEISFDDSIDSDDGLSSLF